jgi:hypothetical protein
MAYVYDEKKMFSFFKTAIFSDESWERLYHNYKIQLAVNYICIIFTTAILMFHNIPGLTKVLLFGSMAAPLLGYLVSEIIIGVKVKQRVDMEELRLLPGNPEFEQKVYNSSITAFSIGYIIILLLVVML